MVQPAMGSRELARAARLRAAARAAVRELSRLTHVNADAHVHVDVRRTTSHYYDSTYS